MDKSINNVFQNYYVIHVINLRKQSQDDCIGEFLEMPHKAANIYPDGFRVKNKLPNLRKKNTIFYKNPVSIDTGR